MTSRNSIGCEIWSVDGDFFEQVLPVDRGAVNEFLASTSPMAPSVWSGMREKILA